MKKALTLAVLGLGATLGTSLGLAAPALATDRVILLAPPELAQASPAPGDELIGTVNPDGTITPIVPPDTVRVYIDQNPIDSMTYQGDVVVGATLPGDLVMQEIPDYQYRYVRINGRLVLVEPTSRRVVYVYQ